MCDKKYRNRERDRISQQKWRLRNKDKLSSSNKRYRIKHQERLREYAKNRNYELKMKCYNHYSNFDIKCNCCGEKHTEFLTIDHINNDGKKRRKEHPSHGRRFYNWLIESNFPSGFQVLCFNCNWAKSKDYEHLCIHQKELIKYV